MEVFGVLDLAGEVADLEAHEFDGRQQFQLLPRIAEELPIERLQARDVLVQTFA